MAAFPPESSFEAAPGKSNADVEVLFEDLLKATKQLPGGAVEQSLTMDANGKVTPSSAFIRIGTFGEAATDDLVGIDPVNMQTTNGAKHGLLWIRPKDSAQKILVKHNAGSTSEIFLADSQDLLLSSSSMRLGLFYTGDQWLEIFRHYGTQDFPARVAMGLGTVATMNVANAATADAGLSNITVITPLGLARYRPQSSGEMTIGPGVKNDWTHNLGSTPSKFWGNLVCKTAQLGWAVGNQLEVDRAAITIWADTTKVGFVCNDDAIGIMNWNNGASADLTPGNWRIVLHAVK
jgi:hypothetical protein